MSIELDIGFGEGNDQLGTVHEFVRVVSNSVSYVINLVFKAFASSLNKLVALGLSKEFEIAKANCSNKNQSEKNYIYDI